MKSPRIAMALFVPFLVASIVGAVARWGLLYPTPETESAFLRSYTPQHVIDRFREDRGFSNVRPFAGGAGRTFVTHDAGFQFFVVMRRENWMPLMNALADDVLRQLGSNGAEVLSHGGDPQGGFRFDYKINHSIGSLRILPLAINSPVRRKMPLPEGLEDVTVKIEQKEQWYPNKVGIVRFSSANLVP